MWNLMAEILAEKMYSHLERKNVLPSEQKGFRKGSHGIKDQRLIHKTVLRDCKKKYISVAIAWINYEIFCDLLPHSWIRKCLEMIDIANNVRYFLNNSMKS